MPLVDRKQLLLARVRLGCAVRGDIDALKRIEDEAFDYDRLSRKSIRQALRSPTQRVLVLEGSRNKTILGAAFLHFRRNSRLCRLYSLAVRSTHRGCGLGRRLLSAAETDAWRQGCWEVRLEVRAGNSHERQLYARNGYTPVGVKLGYYDDGGDAVRYAKRLLD